MGLSSKYEFLNKVLIIHLLFIILFSEAYISISTEMDKEPIDLVWRENWTSSCFFLIQKTWVPP